MKEPKEEVIDMPNENIDSPKISKERDDFQKDEYPVEIKSHEQGNHSDENDEINDTSIQMAVRSGFIRKVYGILSIQLIITFGAVLFCQITQIKQFIFHHQVLSSFFLFLFSCSFLKFGLLS